MSHTRQLFGFHAVTSRIRLEPDSVTELYVESKRSDPRMTQFLAMVEKLGVVPRAVPGDRLDAMVGHGRHQGVVAVVVGESRLTTIDDVFDSLAEPALLVVLDGVQDPHNLGACLRCADALGAHAIIVPKDRAVAVNATVAKVASGAAETVPVVYVTNLGRTLRELKERGVWILGADAGGQESLFTADLAGPLAWVMGAEGSGLRRLTRELCDRIVSIPLQGTVSSLNVSVATGICLFATRQARSSGTPAVHG